MKKATIFVMILAAMFFMAVSPDLSAKKPRNPEAATESRKSNQTSHRVNHQNSYDKLSEPTGFINGHGYVDLGLPSGVKWATCNVGASRPEQYGDYFAWGELHPKKAYAEETSDVFGKLFEEISGNLNYDAALFHWGRPWRMPTESECQELLDICTYSWTKQGSAYGQKFTSRKNGKSIFLPATGSHSGSIAINQGLCGFYYTSSPYELKDNHIHNLFFYSSDAKMVHGLGYFGHTIRPVAD